MAFRQLNRRNRAIGIAGAIAINALLVAGLLTLSTGIMPLKSIPGLAAFDISRPPPPPPPPPEAKKDAGGSPPSRGATKPPSPPKPPQPLASPTPAQPSRDIGSESASGAGSAAGSGAGRGGQGTGTGTGNGAGGGAASPAVRIAGDFTARDYARSGLRGATAEVIVSIRVRSDGRVDQCRVARSSGYAAVDGATCRLLEQRFRFRPARNAAGQAIDSQIQWRADWRPR
jgi:protein TonB